MPTLVTTTMQTTPVNVTMITIYMEGDAFTTIPRTNSTCLVGGEFVGTRQWDEDKSMADVTSDVDDDKITTWGVVYDVLNGLVDYNGVVPTTTGR